MALLVFASLHDCIFGFFWTACRGCAKRRVASDTLEGACCWCDTEPGSGGWLGTMGAAAGATAACPLAAQPPGPPTKLFPSSALWVSVAVILELARTIVANPSIKLAAPVVFLLNGGEETLSQAANGFFASSRRVLLAVFAAVVHWWIAVPGGAPQTDPGGSGGASGVFAASRWALPWARRGLLQARAVEDDSCLQVLENGCTPQACVGKGTPPAPGPGASQAPEHRAALISPSCLFVPRFARGLGAFINLESTGPWGPDVVFQHTGDWTLQVLGLGITHWPAGVGGVHAVPSGTALAGCCRWRASSRGPRTRARAGCVRCCPAQLLTGAPLRHKRPLLSCTAGAAHAPHLILRHRTCAGVRAVGAPPAWHHYGPGLFRPG